MSADRVLCQMYDKYADLSSYQDAGDVVLMWPDSPASKVTFTTRFVRPSLFYFRWTHAFTDVHGQPRNTHTTVWSDGAATFATDNDGQAEVQESLSLAIARFTGVSFGAIYNVASMMIPEVGGFDLRDLNDLGCSEIDFGGARCYRISGSHPQGILCDLVISRDEFLLQQLTERSDDGSFSQEFHSGIAVDEPIDASSFCPEGFSRFSS